MQLDHVAGFAGRERYAVAVEEAIGRHRRNSFTRSGYARQVQRVRRGDGDDLSRRGPAEHGIVSIDSDMCVGCRSCMMACPYNNRYYHAEQQNYFGEEGPTAYETARTARHHTGVVMKCDFCSDRRAEGKDPACVANCAAKARTFGDLDDPTSTISQLIKDRSGFPLHPEAGTNPNVYYLAP